MAASANTKDISIKLYVNKCNTYFDKLHAAHLPWLQLQQLQAQVVQIA